MTVTDRTTDRLMNINRRRGGDYEEYAAMYNFFDLHTEQEQQELLIIMRKHNTDRAACKM